MRSAPTLYSTVSRLETDPLAITIAMIQSLATVITGRASPFHLAPCAACGAPVWQEPCPVCRYYPIGAYDARAQIACTIPCTRERYVNSVAPHQTIAAWFVSGYRRTVAYEQDSLFRRRVDAAYVFAQTMIVLSPEAVWDRLVQPAQAAT